VKGDTGNKKNALVLNEKNLNLKEVEKMVIEQLLERYKGNKTQVAHILGIGRNTLYRKIRSFS
ncbi:MAG: helix-turn-helix domain-containing protein, partial [Thermodesulfobacteriota bacterium]|nr:helix-turn-helix domain-containing protein [Thermodesulfobacteriota bacterium]